jgi:hypothetical protein
MPHTAILPFFRYEHLQPKLRAASAPFCELARWVAAAMPDNDETRACLRKLLEAKDCAVRGSMPDGPTAPPPDLRNVDVP